VTAAGIAAIILLAVGGIYFEFPWWKLLIIAAAVLLIAGGGYLTWRWWKRRKTIAAQDESAKQQRDISIGKRDHGNILDIKKKWTDVVRTLRESKLKGSGDDAIYAFPWYMVIGEPGGGKSTLLKAGGSLSSVVTAGSDGATRNVDWWFFDKIVMLDTSGRYVFQTKESESAEEWHELLNLLRSQRGREPLNGVLIVLPADSLVSKPIDKLKEQAAQLRERLDEMVQRLGVKFPVYFILTKVDRINGFSEFFQGLPDKVRGQALGYANPDLASNAEGSRILDRAFRTLCERLDRLRLSVVYEWDQEDVPRGMFLFPAEFKSLQAPIRSFVEVLFRPSPYRDAPIFRGLFFTSARQGTAPLSRLSYLLGSNFTHAAPNTLSRECFVRDLNMVILPADRGLVGYTATGREGRQLNRAAGRIAAIAAALLLCGVFTLSFTRNWLALSRLDVEPCLNINGGGRSIAEALKPLNDCRENVEELTPRATWAKMSMNFGLRATERIDAALKERFTSVYKASVLTPIEDTIDQVLARGSGASLVLSAILQRRDLLAHCKQTGRCNDAENWEGLNFPALFSDRGGQLTEDEVVLDRFRRTYQFYLASQPTSAAFAEMENRDTERVNRWDRNFGLREEFLVDSTQGLYKPIKMSDYWGPNVRQSQIDGWYTGKAWKEGLSSLISHYENVKPSEVARFKERYKEKALDQWRTFLADFSEVERGPRTSRTSRDLASMILSSDSPYQRILDHANSNLSVVVGSAWDGKDLPPWAVLVKRYAELKSKVMDRKKTGKQKGEEKNASKEDEAVSLLERYLDALEQVKIEVNSTPVKSFTAAQKVIEEGEASSKSEYSILKARWALKELRTKMSSMQEEGNTFWLLLERPLDLAWTAMLDQAAVHLQEEWKPLTRKLSDSTPGQKAGEIMSFANRYANAFLDMRGGVYSRRKFMGQELPFTNGFINYLNYLSRLSPTQLSSLAQNPVPFIEPPEQIVQSY
jgi:type VI secretion system protein ImpL